MKYLPLLLLTTLAFTSCSKERDSECLDGTIEYMGDPAADGLGWVLRTDGENPRYFVLGNLPGNYQVDDLEVNACLYNTGQKMTCFCAEPPDKYAVTSIRKR
ncbi:MAG TPA: hypothetical protein VGE66_19235 [Chitinophagaceae bacterium]